MTNIAIILLFLITLGVVIWDHVRRYEKGRYHKENDRNTELDDFEDIIED